MAKPVLKGRAFAATIRHLFLPDPSFVGAIFNLQRKKSSTMERHGTYSCPGMNRFTSFFFSTNYVIRRLVGCAVLMLLANVAQAGSATWDLNPSSGDWNTAVNWTPDTVPNGPSDTATFGASNTTDVSISADTEVNGITFTAAATKSYTIGPGHGVTLTVSGTGVTNNSGVTQSFTNSPIGFFNAGTIVFTNHATAGTNVFYEVSSDLTLPAQLTFKNNSTAGGAAMEIENGADTNFTDHASAGNASMGVLFGSVSFSGHSTAANANFGTFDSDLTFTDHASAGNAFIEGEEVNGFHFLNNSTAAHANIFTNGEVNFSGCSTAGNAFIRASQNLGGPTRQLYFWTLPQAGWREFRFRTSPTMTRFPSRSTPFWILAATMLRA
jgi:hypothetical protein